MTEQRRSLKDLTFKSDFMFGAAMVVNPKNCAGVIERAIGIPVESVEICTEKSIVYHPEYKGVRLDVLAKDGNHTHYNVEMQVAEKPQLGKRTRYYHSQLDMELLLRGQEYTLLPRTFVIFICDFDPFGAKKYRYTFKTCCLEKNDVDLGDGSGTVFLSTCGKNDHEVPETLVKFLSFVKADLAESTRDFGDEFVSQLQETVHSIKQSREMEGRFMLLEELLREERAEGIVEGIAEGEERFNHLLCILMEQDRMDDLKKASEDAAFRKKLYEEFKIS